MISLIDCIAKTTWRLLWRSSGMLWPKSTGKDNESAAALLAQQQNVDWVLECFSNGVVGAAWNVRVAVCSALKR